LLLNAFWGRFALREDRTSCEFVSSVDKLTSILNREDIEITAIRPIGKQMAVIFYRALSKEVIPMSNNTNIYIASTTTAWARMELYKYLDLCSSDDHASSSAVYCDTDSIFFSVGGSVSTGLHLGELTNELSEGDLITRFVSAGPKTYAYETRNGAVCVKAKGFSLNYINRQVFNVNGLTTLIDGFVQRYGVSGDSRVQLPFLSNGSVRRRKIVLSSVTSISLKVTIARAV
jgi:hypothetical protein